MRGELARGRRGEQGGEEPTSFTKPNTSSPSLNLVRNNRSALTPTPASSRLGGREGLSVGGLTHMGLLHSLYVCSGAVKAHLSIVVSSRVLEY